MLFLSAKSKEATEFRHRVYSEDFGIDPSYASKFETYKQYKEYFADHPDVEDIYKYSDVKFLNSDLDKVMMTDDRTMISGGSIIDSETYRAGHLLYCMKNYRKINRSWLYQDFGAFYAHVKRAIELKMKRVVTCHWAHNAKIAANIENHHRKLIGKELPYFMQMEYMGTWHLYGQDQEVFGYDIEKRFAEIEKLTMVENILPMGEYETLPIHAKHPHEPEKYGCVVELPIDPVDPEVLRLECEITREKSVGYFKQRSEIYKIPPSEALNWLKYNGFSSETYDSTALNIPGTATLNDNVTDYVRDVLSKVNANLFRQNYVIAKNKWETRWHRDHADPSIHGFRLMIPIDPVHMRFRSGDVKLEPGKYYFVNNSLEHIGKLPEGYPERANLMAQMDSDVDILRGRVIL